MQTNLSTLIIFLIAFCNGISSLRAQNDSLSSQKRTLFYEIGGIVANSTQAPFWLRSNQYGTLPRQSPFGVLTVGGKVHFGKKTFRPQLNIEGEVVGSLSKNPTLLVPVGAITLIYRGIEVSVGRRREVIGLGDTLMTSGFYIWSGNALPLPKVQIGTSGFIPLGFTKNFLSFQINFAHGWFGQGQFAHRYYLHQKTLALRMGKAQDKVKLYIGGSHLAQWGGFAPLIVKSPPSGALPSSWKDYWDVVTVRNVNTNGQYPYQIGNQLGTIDALLQYFSKRNQWSIYYQHGIESRGIFKNLPDGLYGISWLNKSIGSKTSLKINHAIFELLTTLNQNTQFDTKSNTYYNDDYFNHPLQYLDGWSYRQRVIGTPFITMRYDTRQEWSNIRQVKGEEVFVQINNNRLQALYGSIQGSWGEKTLFKIKLSSSLNYLSFNIQNGKYGNSINQFSGYFELKRKLNLYNKSYFYMALGYDQGQLLPKNLGMYFGFRQYLY